MFSKKKRREFTFGIRGRRGGTVRLRVKVWIQSSVSQQSLCSEQLVNTLVVRGLYIISILTPFVGLLASTNDSFLPSIYIYIRLA